MIDIRDEGIIDNLNTIFAAVLAGGLSPNNPKDVAIMKEKFTNIEFFLGNFKSRFPMQIFRNEYAVFYEFVMKQNASVFSVSSLRTVIEENFDYILDSPYIDLSAYNFNSNNGAATRDEKLLVFYEMMKEKFLELSAKVVSKPEFASACNIYTSWFKEQYMNETSQNMAMIMSQTGFEYKKPHKRTELLKGSDDVRRYYTERVAVLDSLEEEAAIQHYVYDETKYQEDVSNETPEDAILDYGIAEIDEVKGKMRRGNMIEVMGPPKGGKTTLTTFFVERALSQGLNVAVWPLEGTPEEWKSLIIALMVRKDPANNGLVVDKKNVLMKSYKSDAERQACEAAREALAKQPGRGKLSFIDGAAYCETFEDALKYHYENINPYDVLVMDSPINIMSKYGKNKVERISETYMNLKAYVSKKMKIPAICLVTAQIKQTAVDQLRAHPGEDLDVTAGGESAETIRTPDEIIGVFSEKHERDMNRMQIQSVASRHNRDFDNCYIGCQLGCGYFWSDPSLNE